MGRRHQEKEPLTTEIQGRIRDAARSAGLPAHLEQDIASFLEVEPQTWTGYKEEGEIPRDKLYVAAAKSGWRYQYIRHGTGALDWSGIAEERAHYVETDHPAVRELVSKIRALAKRGDKKALKAIRCVVELAFRSLGEVAAGDPRRIEAIRGVVELALKDLGVKADRPGRS